MLFQVRVRSAVRWRSGGRHRRTVSRLATRRPSPLAPGANGMVRRSSGLPGGVILVTTMVDRVAVEFAGRRWCPLARRVQTAAMDAVLQPATVRRVPRWGMERRDGDRGGRWRSAVDAHGRGRHAPSWGSAGRWPTARCGATSRPAARRRCPRCGSGRWCAVRATALVELLAAVRPDVGRCRLSCTRSLARLLRHASSSRSGRRRPAKETSAPGPSFASGIGLRRDLPCFLTRVAT